MSSTHPQDGQNPDHLDRLDPRDDAGRRHVDDHRGDERGADLRDDRERRHDDRDLDRRDDHDHDHDRPYAADTGRAVDDRDRRERRHDDRDHDHDLDRRRHDRHDRDAVREPGRGKAILAGLLLVLGGALLLTELVSFSDADTATGDGLQGLMGSMGRMLLPVLGLVLMLIAFMVRKSKATILLLVLGVLALLTTVGARLFGDQLGGQADTGNMPEIVMIAGVIATVLTGLLTIAHGIVMFARRNHVSRAERRALARQHR